MHMNLLVQDPQALALLEYDHSIPHCRTCRHAADMARAEEIWLRTDDSFCWDEPYTMPENFFLASQRGGGRRYYDLALRYLADKSGSGIRWRATRMCSTASMPTATSMP